MRRVDNDTGDCGVGNDKQWNVDCKVWKVECVVHNVRYGVCVELWRCGGVEAWSVGVWEWKCGSVDDGV